MICFACANNIHEHCEDENCPCQHKPTIKLPDGTVAPVDSEAAQSFIEKEGKQL